MDQRTRVIIIGAGALFILAAISLIAFFALRSFPISKSPQSSSSNSLSGLPTISLVPSPSSSIPTGDNLNGQRTDIKTFIGQGFNLDYPASWGILTCGNSSNIELDPQDGGDLKNIACDRAIKPITILAANRLNCTGETVKIGEKQVIKSKVTDGNSTNYRWCVPLGSIGLDITHRVSQSGLRATSKEDFSAQIEQLIKTLNITPRGS